MLLNDSLAIWIANTFKQSNENIRKVYQQHLPYKIFDN